jgi:hypothetical protein
MVYVNGIVTGEPNESILGGGGGGDDKLEVFMHLRIKVP